MKCCDLVRARFSLENHQAGLRLFTSRRVKVYKLLTDDNYFHELEKHVEQCDLRYERIEERLDAHKTSLSALDGKLWALAVLIMIAPFVQKIIS